MVDSNIYTKNYFDLHSKGFIRMKHIMDPYIKNIKNMKILDLGCGSGDMAINIASNNNYVVGIDYSKDGIDIANKKRNKLSNRLRENVIFYRKNALKMKFPKNYFDVIVSIDFFEHISKKDLEYIMSIIENILKPNGILIVHTEANSIYLNYTHKYYVYPVSEMLLKLNQLFFKKKYPGLPKDPRNDLHKIQHINEPNYFYLYDLFRRHNFKGKINCRNLEKPILGWKDIIYNILVTLYPLSKFTPLKYILSYDFVCVMYNNK